MTEAPTIRPARRADLPAVAQLAGKLVRMHHGYDAPRFFLPDRIEEGYAWWFGREIDREEVVLLVAARGDAVVGYAYGRLEERDWNQLLDACGALHDILVDESARGRGLGEALLKEVLTRMAKKGQPRVLLHTAVQNESAQRLFKKHGFRTTMLEMTCEL